MADFSVKNAEVRITYGLITETEILRILRPETSVRFAPIVLRIDIASPQQLGVAPP